jgi:shikimate kinase
MNTSGNFPFKGLGGMVIFLIGFMGSGKTYWGNIWSSQTGLSFYDLDALIEEQQQKTIAQIFEQDGENYFRHLETSALHRFANQQHCMVACGGGTPCFNNNMQWMNENGTTIYLKATPQQIYNRVITEQDKRPVIKNIPQLELLSFIEKKLSEREPFYLQAKHILPAGELNATTITKLL